MKIYCGFFESENHPLTLFYQVVHELTPPSENWCHVRFPNLRTQESKDEDFKRTKN